MPEHQQIQQSKKPDTTFQKQATPVVQTPASNPYSIIQRAKINPKSLTHADIMQLQRTIGNQAVGRLLTGIGNTSTAQQAPVQRQETPEEETCPSCMQRQEIPEEEEPLQGKMIQAIQRQEIPEEEEPLQGKMIETIQRQEIPEEEEPLQGKMVGTIQRQEISEEEEPLQGKFQNSGQVTCPSCSAVSLIQKQEIPEEEEPLQGKMTGTIQCQEIPEEEPLQTKRENNTGMPDNLKAGVENLSGIDMSDVRVHYNSDKPADVGALAYTQGTGIHVAPGQERHLSHEAWHVVQQAQGRVKPTVQLKDGVQVNDDKGLEREADVMGERAFQFRDNILKTVAQRKRTETVTRATNVINFDLHKLIHRGSSSVLQPQWDPTQKEGADYQWHELLDGVQWYSDKAGNMWYEVITEIGEKYKAGQGSRKKWVEWHVERRATHPEEYPVKPPMASLQDVPDDFLSDMIPRSDLGAWNAGKRELVKAHHKFPKSPLVWLFEHMTSEDKADLLKTLFLPPDAGPGALARLRSNLISADYGRTKVSSDARSDDPHNNRDSSRPGEEFLDLVHTKDGSLTPRSEVMRSLAHDVAKKIYLHCKLRLLTERIEESNFVLTKEDSSAVIQVLRKSEELHYAIERDPSMPSHSSGDVWTQVGEIYHKQDVSPITVGQNPDELTTHYNAAKKRELKQARERAAVESEEKRQKNAPHYGAYAFMSHSERLG